MSRTFLITSLASGFLCPLALGQQFTYTAAAIPAATNNVWSNGVDLVDVDGDGDRDIVVANGSAYGAGGTQPQHLFLNNGAGSFTAAHAQLNVANFNGQMVIAEDFDKDGDLDLLYSPAGAFPVTTQVPRMLINNGLGVFADESAARIPAVTMSSWGVCAGDVDNDNDLDVVFTDGALGFAGMASQARLFLNNGLGFFTNVTATHLPIDSFNAQDATLFDFDGDFDIDIIISGKGGGSRLYLNDGTGHFSMNSVLNAMGTGNTYEVDWGDLDADNDLDGMVQSITATSEGWGRNNGTAMAATNSTFPAPNGNDDNELAGIDYDNDGDLDVLVGSLQAQEKLYRNNGNSTFTNVNSTIQSIIDSTLDVAIADLNGDNKYDIYTAQGESGSPYVDKVYFNNGPSDTRPPKFLKVQAPALANPNTIFRAMTQDSIQDDGDAQVEMDYAFVVNNGGSAAGGTGTAFHMGGGMFRAALGTGASAIGASVAWCATDDSGNVATNTVSVGTAWNPWTDLGNALAGTNGLPSLAGTGVAIGGSPLTLTLSNALGATVGAHIVGATQQNLSIFGGVLVPSQDFLYPFVTTAGGGATKLLAWPKGLPANFPLYFQSWMLDGAGVLGFAASNAVRATQPY